MKKFFAVLFAAMVLVGSAVPAFAAVNIGTAPLTESLLGKAGCVVVEDGVPYIQTFIVSTLTAEQRAIYDKFIALPDNRKMMLAYYNGNFVTLAIPSSGAKITNTTLALDGFINFRYSGGSLVFDSLVAKPYTLVIGVPASFYLVMGRDFAQDICIYCFKKLIRLVNT